MWTKQKSQTTHICTQRLIETHTDTNKDTHTCKDGNIKIFKHNKGKTNSM